jgi:uncharacterized damage-inducible protein DinB
MALQEMSPAAIQELIKYSYWAFDLVWSHVEQLDNEQFIRDLGYSHGSVRNQIVHLVSSHRRWIYRLKEAEIPQHLEFKYFPSKVEVRTEWDASKVEILDYVMSLDQADLEEEVNYVVSGRSAKTHHPRWKILMHLVNHSTDHLAQLLSMLNMHFGIDTPEQDYILFLWQKDAVE